jgi:hypothetical protein
MTVMDQPIAPPGPQVNAARLSPAEMRREPFEGACIDDFLHPAAARRLSAAWPTRGFRFSSGMSGGKTYQMYRRGLVERGQGPAEMDDLDPAWAELVDTLRSPAYRAAVERMTGRDLGGLEVEVVLWEYEPSCWLSPHTDKPEKVVTQVVYMNDAWEASWGGSFQVLTGESPDTVVEEVVPLLGRCAVIVRSDHSWHAVSPVRDGLNHARRSLQIVFWKPSAA